MSISRKMLTIFTTRSLFREMFLFVFNEVNLRIKSTGRKNINQFSATGTEQSLPPEFIKVTDMNKKIS